MRKYCLASFVLLVIIGLTSQIYGQRKPAKRKDPPLNLTGLIEPVPIDSRESLKGLMEFSVVVEDVETETTSRGAGSKQLQTDTELKLRKAGIKILPTEKEWLLSPRRATLHITLTVIPGDGAAIGLYAWSVDVEVSQEVFLPGNRSLLATTWNVGHTGYVGKDFLIQMRAKVSDLTDQFLNDYLAANRK